MTHYDQGGNSGNHESLNNDFMGIYFLFTSTLRFMKVIAKVILGAFGLTTIRLRFNWVIIPIV
jgi:hypothetical protein